MLWSRILLNGFALYTTWCVIASLINLNQAIVFVPVEMVKVLEVWSPAPGFYLRYMDLMMDGSKAALSLLLLIGLPAQGGRVDLGDAGDGERFRVKGGEEGTDGLPERFRDVFFHLADGDARVPAGVGERGAARSDEAGWQQHRAVGEHLRDLREGATEHF